MEKISLYIADRKVDLDDRSFILFNYTMEDLSNPTIVKNSFSKQITLKGTPTNNEIFGSLYRSDRKTMLGNGNSGIGYDPLRKTPFAIYNEMSEVIESGYVKVDSVSNDSGKIEYKVTLYGGLGSFLYNLTYDESGNKRSLYGLKWLFADGEEMEIESKALKADDMVDGAWTCLADEEEYAGLNPSDYWDIINFAPAYNGLPSDFDANKCIFYNSQYYPFSSAYHEMEKDDEVYTKKLGCNYILATLADKHTEWEMRNIVTYLQRPVVRLRAIINAIAIEAKSKGYILNLDGTFFNRINHLYWNGWMTLPLIKNSDRMSAGVIDEILKSGLSPCEYLLLLVKMCGLVMTCNENRISVMARNTFYGESKTIDLTERIEAKDKTITPTLTQSKWYQLGGDKVVGEEAKRYEEKYGRPYGSQRINTGYDFNSEISPLTKDLPMTGAADVTEVSYANASFWFGDFLFGATAHPLNRNEEIKIQLFKDGTGEGEEFTVPSGLITEVQWGENSYEDWLPKPQFHEEDNKASAGEHCLLIFDGIKSAPALTYNGKSVTPKYYVNGEHPITFYLNSTTPCWCLVESMSRVITALPSFRRVSREFTAEWGLPLEVFVNESMDGVPTLYDRYWKAYLSDRYDVDTKVMRCKVNLSGMQVGQALMRNFFFYDNALWVLNKIENHSISTEDLTECEFVKVKDIDNYKNGQKI